MVCAVGAASLPLSGTFLVSACLRSWDSLHTSDLGAWQSPLCSENREGSACSRPQGLSLEWEQSMEPRKEWPWNTACFPAKEAVSGSAHCLGSHLAHKLPGQEGTS